VLRTSHANLNYLNALNFRPRERGSGTPRGALMDVYEFIFK